VVWQDKQFSWTQDGKPDEPAENDADRRAWEDAGLISEIVLFEWLKGSNGPVAGATYYHANYVTPDWAKEKKWLGIIDDHIFYK
jgi:spore germination cell wall hydrolase CwlJ-like protein